MLRGARRSPAYLLLAALLVAMCSPVVAGGQADPPPALEPMLGRAAWYVLDFIGRFAGIVAEERYVQDSTVALPSYGLRMSTGRGGMPTTTAVPNQRARHRELKSDFLLVKPRPGDDEWMPFRDVFEVDHIPIRDREDRLAKLFLHPSDDNLEAANQIQEESTRYNLGALKRTINNPVFPLVILETEYQWRFKFALARQDRRAGDGVWVVEFDERERPSLIRGLPGQDMMAHGRFWIEAETGRVLKAEIKVKQSEIDATITIAFRLDPALNIMVPIEMREDYDLAATRVTGTATYARFRRFQVTADEDIKTPPAEAPPVTPQ